jgi:Cu/Ag efflux protein CusF
MKPLNRLMTILAAALLMAALCLGQASGKKAMAFQGKVEGVNAADSSLKVNGEKVDGWMEAMTMEYKVDNPAILKTVKTGDTIKATVYEGDFVLHKVQVVKADSKSK